MLTTISIETAKALDILVRLRILKRTRRDGTSEPILSTCSYGGAQGERSSDGSADSRRRTRTSGRALAASGCTRKLAGDCAVHGRDLA